MIKNLRSTLLIIAATSFLGAASSVNADTIEATTSGVVNPATVDGVTIDFVGTTLSTNVPVIIPPLLAFGAFDVSGVSATTSPFSSTFVLTIDQTDPSTDSGNINGTITGAVAYYSNTLHLSITSGSLTLTGGPAPGGAIVPSVTYSLNGGNIGNNIGDESDFDATVYGSVNFTAAIPSVPMPASILSGSALLGGLFLAKTRCRKNIA